MDKTFDELRVMLKANYPLLYFATTEYDRVKQKIRRIAFDLDYSFNSWDTVEGLSSHTKKQTGKYVEVDKHKLHSNTKTAEALLGEIKALIEGELKEEADTNKIPSKKIFISISKRKKCLSICVNLLRYLKVLTNI